MSRQSYKGRLAGRFALQYFISLFLFAAGLVMLFLLAAQLYYSISWPGNSPVYQLAQFVKSYLPAFIAVPALTGWALITFFFLYRPLRYLDRVVAAARELTARPEEPVTLPPALKEVQDELNLIREQSNQNARIAREAEQRKNDLILYLVHDLKTPLASVIGYLTLLRDERQIPEELQEKYLSITLDKAGRLEDLINEFFEIARFNLSDITLEYRKINLTRLLEQLVFEFQPMLREKGLTCRLEAAEGLSLRCDADQLQRVFDNLLRNAVIYSDPDTEIEISAALQNGEAVVRFLNHGITIPPEKLERIFEQFYRLDAARSTRSGGAGLGLAIARRIVELHGGTIAASSADGTVTFTVTLPAS